MSKDIDRLKNYHSRMTTAISELERLDLEDDCLDMIANSYGQIVRVCEHRREVIQRRKYGK